MSDCNPCIWLEGHLWLETVGWDSVKSECQQKKFKLKKKWTQRVLPSQHVKVEPPREHGNMKTLIIYCITCPVWCMYLELYFYIRKAVWCHQIKKIKNLCSKAIWTVWKEKLRSLTRNSYYPIGWHNLKQMCCWQVSLNHTPLKNCTIWNELIASQEI